MLRCGGVAVWGICGVEELRCGGVAVWGSCGVGQSRCGAVSEGQSQCGAVAMWGSRDVGQSPCGGVAVWGSPGVGESRLKRVAVCLYLSLLIFDRMYLLFRWINPSVNPSDGPSVCFFLIEHTTSFNPPCLFKRFCIYE